MNTPISLLLREKVSDVYSVNSESSVLEAVHEMNRLRIGCVVVVNEQNRLVGIFTERDVLQRVVAVRASPSETKIVDVMSTEVETVTGHTTVEEAMVAMTQRRHRHLPVMEDGDIIGLVSIGDITRWISRENRDEADSLREYITGVY